MEKISEVLILSTGQTVKLEGEKGTTFTPSVDANGNLSWTNDGGKQNPTTVNIKGERGEKGDTTVIDPSTATAYTLYNQTGKHTDGAMTQKAVTEKFESLDETYARNDGYYESMGVGTATNLKGQNTVDAEFTYRKSGSNVEVQDGNAMIETIKGNTIAWNQLSSDSNEKTATSRFDNISQQLLPQLIENTHKVLFYVDVKSNNNSYTSVNVVLATLQAYASDAVTLTNITTSYKKYSNILSSYGDNVNSIRVSSSTNVDFTFANLLVFDLTLIYGSGNEPATVEQFKQDYFNWFGKPLTYEPYDAGSLRNTKISALKTVGFNLWDEEWEENKGIHKSGKIINTSGYTVSKNAVPVFPNTNYYFTSQYDLYAYEYDVNGAAIGWLNASNNNNCKNRILATKSNTAYLKFMWYGTTYNHDICINLSDPNRNGEYEPYKESTLPLDVTTLTGKLNGEGSSVVVFADGMNSAGNVHDEIKIENGVVKAIKRVGKVDLGSLTWVPAGTQVSGKRRFQSSDVDLIKPSTLNSVCSIYVAIASTYAADKTGYVIDTKKFIVYDEKYAQSDATTFKTAMSGVMLYHELAEPEVYVLDDFSLPKLYPVANGGTEEQLSNSPNSLPATLSIRYGLNAAAFIQNAPKNYISKESMTNFLSNLGSAMGGTWTMNWNSSTNKYDFTFTQNRSVNVEQPIEDK